ncbi:MAG: hypothetical protein RR620_11965 [Clostridium sp.]
MEFEEGIDLINHALLKIQKDILLNRWIANYEMRGISYEDFEGQVKKHSSIEANPKSEKEIFNQVKDILDMTIKG